MSLSGYEKAAILLGSLGEDAAAHVLKNLDTAEIGRITMHMARVKTFTKNTVDEVLKEASDLMSKGDLQIGGEDFVKTVLNKGLGEEGAQKIYEIASKEGPLESIRWMDPKTLANFLVAEHPQTIALVICLMEPVQAAEVLSVLPERLKADVAARVATSERVPESAIEELKEALEGQLDIGKGKGKKLGGARSIAEILNFCDRTTEQMVIEKIEEQNSILAESIRQLMFVFDDLVKVDNRGIQLILKEVTTEELSLALKTASDALKEKIYGNMSSRASEILKEEIQLKGPVKVTDVEKSQQNIVKIARRLETEGKLALGERGGEAFVE